MTETMTSRNIELSSWDTLYIEINFLRYGLDRFEISSTPQTKHESLHHDAKTSRWKREKNQQDATNLIFIIQLPSEHVSGIIMLSISRRRPCTTACGVLHWLCWLWLCGAGTRAVCTVWKLLLDFHTVHTARVTAPHNHSQHNQCSTPHAVVHGLVLLMTGIMMPETCSDGSWIINIRLVASCWFFSLFTLCSWCTVTRA